MKFSGYFVSLTIAFVVTVDAAIAAPSLGSNLPGYVKSIDQDLTSSLYRRGQCYGKLCQGAITRESADQLLSKQQYGSNSVQTSSSTVKDKGEDTGRTSADSTQPNESSLQRVANRRNLSRVTIRRPDMNRISDNPETPAAMREIPKAVEDSARLMRGHYPRDKAGNKCRRVLNGVKDFSKEAVQAGCGQPAF